jgi:hypothetical protein
MTQTNNRGISFSSLAMASLLALSVALPSIAGTFRQNHPRRAEVLHRDNRLNNQINNDRGHLNGQYRNLERQDKGIRRQEQRDARRDGGHITKGEQRQLNREENHLQREVNRDNSR